VKAKILSGLDFARRQPAFTNSQWEFAHYHPYDA